MWCRSMDCRNSEGERYVLPTPAETDLSGDVAIAPMGGSVRPMKRLAYYRELQQKLEAAGPAGERFAQATSKSDHP
jgi:hypothetical protein